MIKLADTLAPMADFPAVMAEHTAFEDGETLQEKYETGQLGGGGGGYTQLSQAEYDALTEDEKMNGKEYRTYDTGHIYKLGVEYGKDACFTSLSQLGLTAPTTVGEVFMAMPEKSMLMLNVEALVDDGANVLTVTDVPEEYGVLTIDKWSKSRFRIEFNISREGRSTNIKQWIGTLKGTDGTGLKWKELATMDKVALKQECFDKKVTLTDSNWKYETITFEKNYNNTPSINVSCGDYLNTKFYSYWGCEAYIININNKGCTIRYRSSKASESEPLEDLNIIVYVNGI